MSADQRYLDVSAIVKLVVAEPESPALEAWLDASPDAFVSCALARTEVVRAVLPAGPAAIRRARRLLDRLDLIMVDDELLDLAADLEKPLRSLDAIPVAAAMELGDQLEALVTYDATMARVAEALGLPVLAPA